MAFPRLLLSDPSTKLLPPASTIGVTIADLIKLDGDNQWDMSYTRNAHRSLNDEVELYELVD